MILNKTANLNSKKKKTILPYEPVDFFQNGHIPNVIFDAIVRLYANAQRQANNTQPAAKLSNKPKTNSEKTSCLIVVCLKRNVRNY